MDKKQKQEGYVFDIKRFAVHDGPGIRTTIFLKGCPLDCVWCHNPEGKDRQIAVWYNKNLCIACGKCVDVCPTKSLDLKSKDSPLVKINHDTCDLNGKCVEVCPSKSLSFTGYKTDVATLLSEIEKDELFYSSSGGGVTLSGGDALFQPEFALSLIKACKSKGYHTAIESCLFSSTQVLDDFVDHVDLFIVDIKLYNDTLHKKYTGRSNATILNNFIYLASKTQNIIVRIPQIPGITDGEENKSDIEKFVREIDSQIPVELVPYNPYTKTKYDKLGIPFQLTKPENETKKQGTVFK